MLGKPRTTAKKSAARTPAPSKAPLQIKPSNTWALGLALKSAKAIPKKPQKQQHRTINLADRSRVTSAHISLLVTAAESGCKDSAEQVLMEFVRSVTCGENIQSDVLRFVSTGLKGFLEGKEESLEAALRLKNRRGKRGDGIHPSLAQVMFELKNQGLSYKEISALLDLSVKKVEHAIRAYSRASTLAQTTDNQVFDNYDGGEFK